MVDVTEPSLAESAIGGNLEAFSTLVAQHDPAMRAVAYRILASQAAMDDALQAAYLNAFRNISKLREPAGFAGWLRRIVVNSCRDIQRQSGRRAEVPLDAASDVAIGPSTEDRFAQSQQLHAALATLPVDMRAAVIPVDGEGLSYAEAATALGIERGTVASRLNRARAALRHQLGLSEETNR